MSKHCQHLLSLHPIILHSAESQALFAFIQGVLAKSPETPIPEAIILFEQTFCIEDFNRRSALRRYYRMIQTSMRDKKVFTYDDTRKTQSKRKNGQVLRKSLGTPSGA